MGSWRGRMGVGEWELELVVFGGGGFYLTQRRNAPKKQRFEGQIRRSHARRVRKQPFPADTNGHASMDGIGRDMV